MTLRPVRRDGEALPRSAVSAAAVSAAAASAAGRQVRGVGPGVPCAAVDCERRARRGLGVRHHLGGPRHDGEALSAGAVLHDTGLAVGLSNTWSREAEFDWKGLLDVVAGVHPGQALVGYAAEAGPFTAAGFEPVGPQQVWERLDVTSL